MLRALLMLALLGHHIPRNAGAAESEGIKLIDEKGGPVSGAAVHVWLPPSVALDLGSRLIPLCEAKSSDEGVSPCVPPRLVGALLIVDAAGFQPLVKQLDGSLSGRVVLRPGAVLRGRIVSPGKLPRDVLAASRLSATVDVDLPERGQTFRFDRVGSITDDGDLVITGLSDSAVTVRLDVPRFLPWIAKTSPDRPFEAQLKPGILVAGHVTDLKQRAIAGARIGELGVDAAASVKTDEEGRFTIAVRVLPASLEAVAAGYRATRVRVIRPEDAAEVVIRCQPGEGVTGSLFSSGGDAIARVTVWIESSPRPGDTRSDPVDIRTDSGSFRVDLPRPGMYDLRFDATGHQTKSVFNVDVGAGTYPDLGEILLQRGAGVTGTLIDAETGEPVSGAVVELQTRGSPLVRELRYRRAIRALSGERGEFVATGAAEGSYVLRVRAARYPTWFDNFSLDNAEVRDLGRVLLGEGAAVSGIVVNRADTPQPGVAVRFFDPAGESAIPLTETTTGNDGRFSGLHLRRGHYLVRVFSERLLLSQPVDITEAEREARLRLVTNTVRIRGVVQRRGNPVDGGTVSLVEQLDPGERQGKIVLSSGASPSTPRLVLGLPSSMLTLDVSAFGEFSSDQISAGSLLATYRSIDGHSWTRRLTVPDVAEAKLVVELGGISLEGRVEDQQPMPISGAQLDLATESGRRLESVSSTEDGLFAFRDLEEGYYTITARAQGYRAKTLSGIAVAGTSPMVPLRVVLSAGTSGTLSVRLVRASSAPGAYVPLTLLDGAGVMVRSLPTDSHGVRLFEDLPPSTYTVVWADPFSGVGASEPLSVSGDKRVEYSNVLDRGVPVEVECASPTCENRPVEFLHVFTPSGIEIGSYLSGISVGLRLPPRGGRLMLGTLSPGSYRLRIGVVGRVTERTLRAHNAPLLVLVP